MFFPERLKDDYRVGRYCLPMRYYYTSKISDNMAMTPEGYLLCLGVAIARTGVMEYLADEVPVEPRPGQDTVLVRRDEADVFAQETMASYEGKPVTIGHPDDFVTPDNYRELAMGHALNVRRGGTASAREGGASDLLLADLLITDPETIEEILGGLREVSCGYDADYEDIAPGVGRQYNITGNHIALVDRGRCGPRCKIKDKDTTMSTKTVKKSFLDWLKGKPKLAKAFDAALEEAAKDEEPAKAEDGEAPPDKEGEQATDGGDATEQIIARLDELTLLVRSLAEAKQTDEDNTEDGDDVTDDEPDKAEDGDSAEDDEEPENKPTRDRALKRGSAKDTARKRTADADTVRRAKILAPGVAARVGDSDCAVKRTALRSAMRDNAVSGTVNACLRGSTLDKADCLTLDAAFVAASEVAAARNNRKTADNLTGAKGKDNRPAPVTPAQINASAKQFWDNKLKGGK